VLTIVRDYNATEIDLDNMERAIVLADWYVQEALRLRHCATGAATSSDTQVLLAWMQSQLMSEWSLRDLQNRGSGALRRKERLAQAISSLEAAGRITRDGNRIRLRKDAGQL
jgi:hypothetical protein